MSLINFIIYQSWLGFRFLRIKLQMSLTETLISYSCQRPVPTRSPSLFFKVAQVRTRGISKTSALFVFCKGASIKMLFNTYICARVQKKVL